jgi:class 3 adenylate cyclase
MPSAAESSAQREFHAERRIATVMFADISGFTAFSECSDPEHTRDVVNACFQRLVPIILEHGGQIDKFIGAEIMALFGATQANEDDARRALDAALGMMAAMDEFSRSRNVTWNLHVGVNTGLVVAGMVGAEAGRFSVIGDAVNVAARLVGQAKPGEIVVGEKTCRLAREHFDFEPVQNVRLKGKSASVDVYRLVGPRNAECEGRFPPAFRAQLLGRAAEVAAVSGVLERREAGRPFILVVSGEAGVGKSRLLAEIRRTSPLRWFEGKSVPMGRSISFWPFIQILREIFGIADVSNEAQAAGRIVETMRALFSDGHQEFTPYLAQLLSIRLPGPGGQVPEHM